MTLVPYYPYSRESQRNRGNILTYQSPVEPLNHVEAMVTSLVNEVVCLSQSGTSNLWYMLLQYLWEIMGISPEMDSSAKHSQAIWHYIVQKH